LDKLENLFKEFLSREDRNWPRQDCNYITEYNDLLGNRRTCTVINISGSGLGILSRTALHKGEIVFIADPRIKAKVIWVAEGRAGLYSCS